MAIHEHSFPEEVFQLGCSYYNRARVSRIHINHHQGMCQVRGQQIQHVHFVIDESFQIIQMSCDCLRKSTYCEHEAAAYIKYMKEMEAKRFVSIEYPSLVEIYQSLKVDTHQHLSDQQFDIFVERLKVVLELIVRHASVQNVEKTMEDIKTMMRDYSQMNLYKQQRAYIDALWFPWFRKLFRQQPTYKTAYCEWIEQLFLTHSLPELTVFFLKINQDLPDYCLFPLYSRLLTNSCIQDNMDYVQPLSLYMIQHYKKHRKDIQDLEGQLPENSILFLYHQMSLALLKKDYQQALNFYQRLRYQQLSPEIINELVDIENTLYFHNYSIDEYKKYVLQYYQETQSQENIKYLKCLKEKYGEMWNKEKFMIYDILQKCLNVATFHAFIDEMEEWQWPIYLLLKTPSFQLFLKYDELIRKHDLENYFVVFLTCLMHEIQYLSNSQDYQMVPFYIDQQKLYGISWTVIREMIDEIKTKYKKRPALISVLDEYLERCDRVERAEYENLCRKSGHYSSLTQI